MSDLDNTTLEDTDKIQKAIENVVDEETSTLPIIPSLDDILAENDDDNDITLSDAAESIPPANASANETSLHNWFFTFMCMNIPIAGWIYLFYLAFNKKKVDRRSFARAYLFYKLLFLLISAVILGILVYVGLHVLDQVLAYMEML